MNKQLMYNNNKKQVHIVSQLEKQAFSGCNKENKNGYKVLNLKKKLTVGPANLEHFFIGGPPIRTPIVSAITTLSGYEIDGSIIDTIPRARALDAIFLIITVDEAQTWKI